MSDYFLGCIKWFPYTFTPNGFQDCDGSLLPINEFDALYALLGTTYGGDGQTTFAVPDLRGRVPVHQGAAPGLTNRAIGERGGTEAVTLTATQMPAHTHFLNASTAAGTSTMANGNVPAGLPAGTLMYVSDATGLSPATLGKPTEISGGSQPHENRAPTLTIRACIALYGNFPARN